MNAPPVHPDLSPDAYAVLIDVAKQPDSILLTVDPRKASRELLEPSDLVQPTAAFLTSAERHLLAAHRDEVGRWLDNLISVEVLDHPVLAGRTYQRRRRRDDFALPLESDCRRHLSYALASHGAPAEVAAALASIPVGRPHRGQRLLQLAAASRRLHDTPHSNFHAGLIRFADGHLTSARTLFTRTAQRGGLYARVGHEWIGVVAVSRRQWHDARDAYATASRSNWASVDSVVNWTLNAMQCGDERALDEALDHLRGYGELQPAERDRCARSLAVDRWSPTEAFTAACIQPKVATSALSEVLRATA